MLPNKKKKKCTHLFCAKPHLPDVPLSRNANRAADDSARCSPNRHALRRTHTHTRSRNAHVTRTNFATAALRNSVVGAAQRGESMRRRLHFAVNARAQFTLKLHIIIITVALCISICASVRPTHFANEMHAARARRWTAGHKMFAATRRRQVCAQCFARARECHASATRVRACSVEIMRPENCDHKWLYMCGYFAFQASEWLRRATRDKLVWPLLGWSVSTQVIDLIAHSDWLLY